MFTPGYVAGHSASGQCPKPVPAPVRSGCCALAVNPLPPATPGLRLQAEYALAFFKEQYLSSRPESRLFFNKKTVINRL